MARVAAAVAVLVFWSATSEAQTPQLDIGSDLRVIEGNSGTTGFVIQVFTSVPSLSGHSVGWRTLAGSAAGGSDFIVVSSGLLTWLPGDPLPKSLTVDVVGDTIPEWSPTLQQDEVFFVELFSPTNATIGRARASVTIIDDDTVQPGAQFLSAVTDSTGSATTDGRNRLQWRVPASDTPPQQFKVCWKSNSSACTPPLSDTDTDPSGCALVSGPFTPGGKVLFTHDNTSTVKVDVPKNYCYTVFTLYPSISNERAVVEVRTFDSTPGPVKWTMTPGHYAAATAADVVPPTVGLDGVYSVGTDGVVYAMQRGITATSGLWPPSWNPVALGKPAHNRSPVVPFGGGSLFFVGTESGELHAVDAKLGSIAWSRAANFPAGSRPLMTGSLGTQATPAGLFKAFGGQNDLLLVGTATAVGNTSFFALDPRTGATMDSYPSGGDTPPGPIDNVYGMAVVDYATNKVYFGTAGSAFTLWGLDMGSSGAPDLKLLPAPVWNPKPLGTTAGTTGAPVMRNGRLYLGTDSGASSAIHSLRVSDGLLYSYTHGDGEVKGFVWPDRRDDRLYFSTVNNVHGVRDDGTQFLQLWSPISVQSPSIPLQKPGSNYLYVGDGQGRLLQIDVVTKAITPLPLDTGTVQIGAPSLDNAYSLVMVGSDKGVIYAVRVPY